MFATGLTATQLRIQTLNGPLHSRQSRSGRGHVLIFQCIEKEKRALQCVCREHQSVALYNQPTFEPLSQFAPGGEGVVVTHIELRIVGVVGERARQVFDCVLEINSSRMRIEQRFQARKNQWPIAGRQQ